MTAPVDPTGKRAKLKASSLWLAGLVAAGVAAGVLHQNTAPPTNTTGCPASLPGALIVHFGQVATSGAVTRDTVSKPVVICGPASMVYNLQAHPEATAIGPNWPGGGATSGEFYDVITSPPDTLAAVLEDTTVALTAGSDSLHWAVADTTALPRVGVVRLVVSALTASRIKLDSTQRANWGIPIVETSDTIPSDTVALGGGLKNGPLPVWAVMGSDGNGHLLPHYFYRPARGDKARFWTVPIMYPLGTKIPAGMSANTTDWSTWLNTVIPKSQTVLDLTMIKSTGTWIATTIEP